MKTLERRLRVLATALLLTLPSAAQDLTGVLARMDQAAPNFRGMSADVLMVQYTKLLDDKGEQSGTVQMQRLRDKEVRAILDFPGEQTLAFSGKSLIIYYPRTGVYQQYPASNLGNALNQFLLLGFGSSGHDLKQSYDITADGVEKIGERQAVKLILIPKDQKVAQKLPKAALWIPEDEGYPVQQQFWEPASGNYRLLTYSQIKINPPMEGKLEFKPPSGSRKQR